MKSQVIPKESLRSDVNVQKIPTTVSVVAAALIGVDGRVLMHQRRFGGELGGLWEFPGGKVEALESNETALARELAEELGVVVDPVDLTYLDSSSEPGNPHVIALYTCRCWAGQPRCLTGEAIAWVPSASLLDLAMPPLDVPLARALLTLI
jgi:8-oxo-dGTP diphosphatase